jgi:hypothetical protein
MRNPGSAFFALFSYEDSHVLLRTFKSRFNTQEMAEHTYRFSALELEALPGLVIEIYEMIILLAF